MNPRESRDTLPGRRRSPPQGIGEGPMESSAFWRDRQNEFRALDTRAQWLGAVEHRDGTFEVVATYGAWQTDPATARAAISKFKSLAREAARGAGPVADDRDLVDAWLDRLRTHSLMTTPQARPHRIIRRRRRRLIVVTRAPEGCYIPRVDSSADPIVLKWSKAEAEKHERRRRKAEGIGRETDNTWTAQSSEYCDLEGGYIERACLASAAECLVLQTEAEARERLETERRAHEQAEAERLAREEAEDKERRERSQTNSERVDAYFAEVLSATGRKLTRKEFNAAAGYTARKSFEQWQRRDPHTPKKAAAAFERILSQKPHLPRP